MMRVNLCTEMHGVDSAVDTEDRMSTAIRKVTHLRQ